MALRLITAPSVEPLTLAETKQHLRVDATDDDTLIASYIAAARNYCDGQYSWLGRALVTQTWELVIDTFPTSEIVIPLPPLQSVISVKYDDSSGVEQTVASTNYFVDNVSEPGWVVPIASFNWPTTLDGINAVRIRYIAGYPPDASSPPDLRANIPFTIKAGMLLMIGNLYENREDNVAGTIINKMPFGTENLLRPHRVRLGMA